MRYLILILLLTGCQGLTPKKIYPLVNGEVLNNGWYKCEFGVLQYVGGNRPVLDIEGDPIPCARLLLTHKEYCAAQKPLGDEPLSCR